MKKVLIIKLNNNGFERWYADNLKKHAVDVCDLQMLVDERFKQGLLDWPMYTHLQEYARDNTWDRYEVIIVFDAVYLVPALWHVKNKHCRLILWMWNTVGDCDVRRINLAKEFAEVWTFDKKDAEQFGLHYSNQFYFRPDDQHDERNEESVFFVGADKNRMQLLCSVSKKLSQIEYVSDFFVLPDQNQEYGEPAKGFLLNDWMDYSQVLEHVRKCTAVLDLVKEGQVGITVRTLEAVFYKKKVITNNAAVKYCDLYDSGNIYILDHEKEALEEFLKAEVNEYPDAVLDRYTAATWLKNLCGEREDGHFKRTGKQQNRQTGSLLYFGIGIAMRLMMFFNDRFLQKR